jgi:FMN phosphatase YigB (HAD superfamily)
LTAPERSAREERLARLLPELDPEAPRSLAAYTDPSAHDAGGRLAQVTDLQIAGWLRAHGVPAEPGLVPALRRALVVPAEPFYDGSAHLLRTTRDLGLRTVILSNTAYTDAGTYRSDLEAAGLSQWVDGIVTSADAGVRKPLPAIFLLALRAAGCLPEEAVMVGNSERADIEPAVALGMRAVLVAIDDRVPARSEADAVVTSLHDAAAVLIRLAKEEVRGPV